MKKLQMTFYNALGKKHRFTPKIARQDLTADEVRQVMTNLVTMDVFEKNGVKHCTGVSAAKYVETIETPLFDDEN